MQLKNEIILASAGSGKTYRLTNRYISLLQLGVEPERIIALTFTRKAAGEFFDVILEKLAKSAGAENEAGKIARDLGDTTFTRERAGELLREFIDAMPRLALGTLDSFLADIVRAFPFELGLGGGFEILDEHGIAVEKERVYQRAFGRGGTGGDEFLESFKLATYGREDAGLMRNLDEFVKDLHELYLSAPSPAQWGNAEAIWPGGCPWKVLKADALANLTAGLQAGFDAAELKEKVPLRWRRFFEWLKTHQAGAPVPSAEKTLLGHLFRAAEDLAAGSAVITVDRIKHELSPPECAALLQIVGHLVGGEIEARLSRTRGLWKVLEGYEKQYSNLVRRRGKLTFADLALLLADAGSLAADPDNRERLDYRLDARFEHWLLDEFQDTSAVQWSAIERLVDEAAQDPEGRRSLFQVGDLKQAIYGWRGGDATLFEELADKYAQLGGDRFTREPLDKSYRSSPAVLEPVNAIFKEDGEIDTMFPAMAGRWQFQEHSTVHAERPGYSAWIAAEPGEGSRPSEDDKLAARLEIVAQLITDIDPLRRGLSIAVLVGRNRIGSAATDYLRASTDLPITNEADVGIAGDNPLTVALRSLFRCAAHPGDGFAWQHLQMTPLRECVGDSADALGDSLRRAVWRHGFETATREWLAKLDGGLDPFSMERGEEFCRAAARFDAGGSRSIDEFLRFMDSYTLRDASAGGSVQVMTVHKSKGLGFDIVILPDLGTKGLDVQRREIGVQRGPNRGVEWILQMPNKDICMADPTLRDFIDAKAADACYENLCAYYVALTRAKYANYLVTDALPKRSSSNNFIKLLDRSLREGDESSGTIYETGAADWFEQLEAEPSEPAPPSDTRPLPGSRRERLDITAAEQKPEPLSSETLFKEGTANAR